MEALEDQTHIVKGKRSKRQRLQSPIPFSIATTHYSSTAADGGPMSLENSNEFVDGAATEEEEDMANCLILLAQGGHDSTNRENQQNGLPKFNSKIFLETPAAAGNGKVGIYVFQCQTCNRTFPSFQALGGHRASHKKPKPKPGGGAEEKRRPAAVVISVDEEEERTKASPLDFLKRSLSSSSSSKVHECSICGAEFTSGQALGGHMSRHRGAPPPVGSNGSLSQSPPSPSPSPNGSGPGDDNDSNNGSKRHRNVLLLDLDLNLPVSEGDIFDDSHLALASKQQNQQQQLSLVLSTAPALVDCHY